MPSHAEKRPVACRPRPGAGDPVPAESRETRLLAVAASRRMETVERFMRLRTFVLVSALAVLGLGTACSGGDDEDGTPTATAIVDMTPAPTATPLASVPDPIVVTGSGTPGGGASASEDAAEYVVEAGDTISGISSRFGVDADLIREANDIEDDAIFVGQTLLIPRGSGAGTGGTESTPEATTPPASEETPEDTTPPASEDGEGDTDEEPEATTPPVATDGTYTVQEGDTAFGIALEFDTTVEALAAANDMTEEELENLQIGQVINLPAPE